MQWGDGGGGGGTVGDEHGTIIVYEHCHHDRRDVDDTHGDSGGDEMPIAQRDAASVTGAACDAVGAFKVNPHSRDFDAERAFAKSPATCAACHIRNPLIGRDS